MEHKLWIRVGVVMTVQKNSKQQTNGKRKCFITHQLIAIENWVRSIMIIIVLPFLFYICSVRCDFCSSSPSVLRQNGAIRVNTKKKKRTWKIEFIKLSWRIAEQQWEKNQLTSSCVCNNFRQCLMNRQRRRKQLWTNLRMSFGIRTIFEPAIDACRHCCCCTHIYC